MACLLATLRIALFLSFQAIPFRPFIRPPQSASHFRIASKEALCSGPSPLCRRSFVGRRLRRSQLAQGVKTIETYRSRFVEKLGLRTRSDVVRFAVQMGLLTPETLENEPGSSSIR